MNAIAPAVARSPKDYASDQEVRWCPGCGDYAILKAVQKTLADLNAATANTVFVSGIGCSSRFPYYLSTYGFHTIHGRAPAVATGVKLANPALDVWIVTGDGDGLSIGGNHMLHLLRRDLDVQVLLFNNEIYGLTKGQYSPTSRVGTRSPSSPGGSTERPVSPALFALGAGARFVARAVDVQQKPLVDVLKRAHAHPGTAFVEIYQNCIVYNDDVFAGFTEKAVAADNQIHVAHGQPLRFGRDGGRGLVLDTRSLRLTAVTLGDGGAAVADLLVHDETNPVLATMLAAMQPPDLPVALGVLYCDPAVATGMAAGTSAAAPPAFGSAELGERINALLHRGETWTVAPASGVNGGEARR
jgi:2-oxoglutarate ferredoxin oxidoreductase subunit beta